MTTDDPRASRLEARLAGLRPGRRLGRRVVVRREVASTNDLAWDLVRSSNGAADGLVVLADRQTRGRGRSGRIWDSPVGCGLYLSTYVRLDWAPERAVLLTLAAGLAVARACEAESGVRPDLKWPNDIMAPDASGRKLGGILVETRSSGGRASDAVIGVGVNVAQQEIDFPPELRGRAASLALVGGRPCEPWALAAQVIEFLEEEIERLECRGGEEDVVVRWREAARLWGRPVSVEHEGRTWTGVAQDLAPDGGLVVRRTDGAEIVVHAGDVAVAWGRV